MAPGSDTADAQAMPTPQRSLAAISFDADQTLWDFRSAQREALAATIEAMVRRGDVAEGAVDASTLQAVRDEVVKDYRGRVHSLEEIRERSFAVYLDRIGHPSPTNAARDLVEIFLRVRFDRIELFADVAPSLARLRSVYKIGLLSNGNTYPERCGLPDTFDAVVLGPSHGFEKPDRRAFETLANQLGVELGRMAHVGDDVDDIDGANGAGVLSVFINRDGKDPEFRSRAEHEVSNLVELEALLSRL